jgi:hypothetical protein
MNNKDPVSPENMEKIKNLSKSFEYIFDRTAEQFKGVRQQNISDETLYETFMIRIMSSRHMPKGITEKELKQLFEKNKKRIRDKITALRNTSASTSASASASAASASASSASASAPSTGILDNGFSLEAANKLRAERTAFIDKGIEYKMEGSQYPMNLNNALKKLMDKASSFGGSDKYIDQYDTPVKHKFLLTLIRHIQEAFNRPKYPDMINRGKIEYIYIPPRGGKRLSKRKVTKRRATNKRKATKRKANKRNANRSRKH